MDLAGKYEKTNLIGDGDVQVWRGREKARGNSVLLHQFTVSGSPALLRLAVEYLLARPSDSPLLEIGEMAGATCLATKYDLGLLDLADWLETAVQANRIAGSVLKPGPGEFTRALQIPSAPASFQRSEDSPGSGALNKLSPKPGEFTQLFQVPGQPGGRETPRTPALGSAFPPDPSSSSARPAGEFTRLFRPPATAPSALPDDRLGILSASGALQQKFPPAEPAKPGGPSGALPIPEPAVPPKPAGHGEYTRVIQVPRPQALAPQTPSSPAPHPDIPTLPATPSFQAASAPAINVQASAPAPAGHRSGIPPIALLLGALVLIALVLVLVFALRK